MLPLDMDYVSFMILLKLENMKRLQPLVAQAIKAAKRHLLHNGEIASEMNGYISSFSASVTNAGLLPAIIFYSHKGGSQEDRPAIVLCLQDLVGYTRGEQSFDLLECVKELYEERSRRNVQVAQLRQEVQDAAVALKMAIRIFPKADKTNKPQN